MTHICVHEPGTYKFIEAPTNLKPSFSHFSEITHKTKPHDDALGKRIWDDSETVYWKMETDYPYIEGRKLEEKAIKLAFLEASFETPLVIRQRKRSTADAQIIINWFGSKDEPFFKDRGSTLAFGYGPSRGIGGDITMNADKPWGLMDEIINGEQFSERFERETNPNNKYRVYDSQHTLKHEGGHAIGMNHLTDTSLKLSTVMYPFYNGLRKFGEADLAYLHLLYGKANINHRIKEILLARIGRGVMA